jgi:WD40 repeat protein
LDPSRQFVALADDKNVKVWDLAKARAKISLGQEAVPFKDPFPGVDCVRFSPDMKNPLLLASSYSYNPSSADIGRSEVRRYHIEKETWVKSPGSNTQITAPIVGISFVDNSTKLAVLTTEKLAVYDVSDKGPLLESMDYNSKEFLGSKNGPLRAGIFNAEGTCLIISYENGYAEIYNLKTIDLSPKPLIFTIAEHDHLQSVAFSSNSSRIATGSSLGWVGVLGNPQIPGSSGYSTIARMTGSISAVALQGTEKGKKGETVAAGTVWGNAAVFQKSRAGKESRASEPWLLGLNPEYTERGFLHYGTVTAVSFSDSGKSLVTASEDQKARVFDVDSGLETRRVAHNRLVVSAVLINTHGPHELLVSASQDADVEITDLDRDSQTVLLKPLDDSCPLEALSASRQHVWPSFVSASDSWTWACDGRLHSLSKSTILDYGKSIPASMHFNQDGSALAWLDLRLGIHYARRSDSQRPWTQTLGAWIDLHPDEPKPFVSLASLAILAISPNGNFVGVSFITEKGASVIEVFKVHEDSGGVSLEQLRNETSDSMPGKDEPQLEPYGVDAGTRRQVLSLAVSSQGSIAAGTANNGVFRFIRQGNKWESLPISLGQDTGGQLGPSDRVIDAVGFIGDGDGTLVVARGDSSIWLFSASEKPLYPSNGKPDPLGDANAKMFVFGKAGKNFAAIAEASVTFFTIDTNTLKKGLTLHEPGVIQSVALGDDQTATTSVALRDSLIRITHNLKIEKHEQWICENQPKYQDPKLQEEIDCSELREHWVPNSCFWPPGKGGSCPAASNAGEKN